MNFNTALEKLKERLPEDITDRDKEKKLHVNNITRIQKELSSKKEAERIRNVRKISDIKNKNELQKQLKNRQKINNINSDNQ
ncbi:MAG: hypothetical protein J0665_11420 [Deltaproteobacteria bacterium]|nr:hypothetical protein [Deltaproteobacteria bacterium]